MDVNIEQLETDRLRRFWTSFNTWSNKSDILSEFFCGEYIQWDNWNEGGIYA